MKGRTPRGSFSPRPETVAFARGRRSRPLTAGSVCGAPLEDELRVTRLIAKRLLAALRVRQPLLASTFLDDLEPETRATVDRVFEAMYILLLRDGVRTMPCRKLLESQDSDPGRYSVERTDGTWRIVDEAALLALAGVLES